MSELKTREEELPLIYLNSFTGNRLMFSWLVDDRKQKIPGKFIFVEQNSKEEIVNKGTLHGLKAVNDMRNNAIRQGWRFYHLPKIDLKDKQGNVLEHKPKEPVKKKRVKKPGMRFSTRRRNPAETFEEMKKRVQKNTE